MSSNALSCRLKLLGILGSVLDDSNNLVYVNSVTSPYVILPYGIHGLIKTGFSGLPLEVLKFNKDLVEFELTSLSNCNNLREIYIYSSQISLIKGLSKLYPNLQVVIRKGL